MDKENYLIVSPKVLPYVFEGVVLAKELLASGRAASASAAAKAAGISRSAFYKYKDFVFKYSAPDGDKLTLGAILSDRAGVFSALTAELYSLGVNIVTVTQGIPENGTAAVLLTANVPKDLPVEELLERLRRIDGVITVRPAGVE